MANIGPFVKHVKNPTMADNDTTLINYGSTIPECWLSTTAYKEENYFLF